MMNATSESPLPASDDDLNRLFGVKKPFAAPIHLSHPLDMERRLTADEAAQICERDSAIKPNTRASWSLHPIRINGVLWAGLSRISARGGRHAEATWHLPVASGIGQLRLTADLGDGRKLSKDECRQMRSIGGDFAGANPNWAVKPSSASHGTVTLYRYTGQNRITVGSICLAPEPEAPTTLLENARPAGEARERRQFKDLPESLRRNAFVLF